MMKNLNESNANSLCSFFSHVIWHTRNKLHFALQKLPMNITECFAPVRPGLCSPNSMGRRPETIEPVSYNSSDTRHEHRRNNRPESWFYRDKVPQPMNSIETQNLIDVLKTRHRLAVLQATLRQVEHSTQFDPEDESFLEIKAMFRQRIDLELSAISQPAD